MEAKEDKAEETIKKFAWTTEEETEMKAFPIPSEPRDQKQFALRLAKKLHDLLMCDPTITPQFLDVYEKYPMWQFYTDSKHSNAIVRRSYGVHSTAETTDEEPTPFMMSCRLHFVNDVVGGVPGAEAFPIAEWTPEQIAFVKMSQIGAINQAAFLDPLGFMVYVQ